MKKLAVFWVIGAALAFAVPSSFGEVHGAGGMHGHEMHAIHDHGHGFQEHGHFRGHDRVIIGFPFWWVPPAYYNSPRYIEQPPAVFVDQDSDYWYYCPNPAGYYPNVQNCPIGWLRVVPDAAP